MERRTVTTPPRAARGRLDSIQVMRGVAALLVVFAHAVDLVQRNPQLGVSRIAGVGAIENIGAIGVDLFFIISGFVMALSVARLAGGRDARRFLVLRWARIAPPFLIACGLLICLHSTVGGGISVPWRSVANSVLFVPVVDRVGYTLPVLDVGWSLSFEFTFYLAVALMVLLGLARRLELLALAMLGAIGLGMVVDPTSFLLTWVANPIIAEFTLGLFAYWLWDKGVLDRARVLQWALGGLAAGVLATEAVVGFGTVDDAFKVLDGSLSAHRVLLWGLPLFFVFIALLPLGRDGARGRLGVAARRLGDASYSIYLVHMLAFVVLAAVLGRLPAMPLGDVVLLGGVATAAVAGLGFHRWVEQPINDRVRSSAARRDREWAERNDPAPASGPVAAPVATGARPVPVGGRVPTAAAGGSGRYPARTGPQHSPAMTLARAGTATDTARLHLPLEDDHDRTGPGAGRRDGRGRPAPEWMPQPR